MKVLKALALTLIIALFVAGLLFAQEKGQKEQTICPVVKGKINKNLYVDHQGKRVYFCCQSCVGEFKKAPDKYMKQMEEEGIALKSAPKPQSTSPYTGFQIDNKYYVDSGGYRIFGSSEEDAKKIKERTIEAIEKLKAKGEMPETRIVVCPKCGEALGSKNCCNPDAERCDKCGLIKGSIGCCKDLKPAAGEKDVVICEHCGEVKGSAKCCDPNAALCEKCGLIKDSPGCCKLDNVFAVVW